MAVSERALRGRSRGQTPFLRADNGGMSQRHPTSSTISQGVVGTLVLLALAAIPLWWATEEAETGNRLFLLGLGALLLALAIWRGASTARAAARGRTSASG